MLYHTNFDKTSKTLEELVSDYTFRSRVLASPIPFWAPFKVYSSYDCQPVDMDWIKSKIYDWIDAKNKAWTEKRRKKWKFRNGPVPGTHGGRKNYSWFRNPKTIQEMKSEDKYTRAKRRCANIPSSYDDIHRSDVRYNKPTNWKNSRLTQWK